MKGLSPELAWPPQVGSYLTVCTCGREPSWESRYIQQRRKRRHPPTCHYSCTIILRKCVFVGQHWVYMYSCSDKYGHCGPFHGQGSWGWPDFCHMLAQLFFCSFAQHHCNFRKTLAKVPDAVGTVQPAGRGSQITIFYCTFLYIQYFTLCTLYFDFTQNCQSVLSAICIVAVRLY